MKNRIDRLFISLDYITFSTAEREREECTPILGLSMTCVFQLLFFSIVSILIQILSRIDSFSLHRHAYMLSCSICVFFFILLSVVIDSEAIGMFIENCVNTRKRFF